MMWFLYSHVMLYKAKFVGFALKVYNVAIMLFTYSLSLEFVEFAAVRKSKATHWDVDYM